MITEYNLSLPVEIIIAGIKVAMAFIDQSKQELNTLVLRFINGTETVLRSAIDVSEQISYPRLFVIEEERESSFIVFGGESIYWLNQLGDRFRTLALNRRYIDAEYWTTTIVKVESMWVIVYEGGIVAFDRNLEVTWHVTKFYNDIYLRTSSGRLIFERDHAAKWSVALKDGSLQQEHD